MLVKEQATKRKNSTERMVVLAFFIILCQLAAWAQKVDVVCLGSTAMTFTPGLRSTTQGNGIEVQELDTYSTCVSSDRTVTAATDIFEAKLPLSCNVPSFAPTAEMSVKWSNGKSSTFRFNFTTTVVNGHMIILGQGTVSAGLFSGGTALVQYTYVHPSDQQCEAPAGITSAAGQTGLQIFTMNLEKPSTGTARATPNHPQK